MRLVLALILLLAPCPGAALELTLQGFYDLNRPASLEFDPAFCGLWIANEGPEVILVTLDGLELRRFRSDLNRVKAITLLGPDVLVADGFGNYQRLSRDGMARGAAFRLGDSWMDTEGMVEGGDGELILVEDDPSRIVWMTQDGAVLREIDGMSYDPVLSEPQGIARDPRNGHLLVVDDWEGTNSLFELDAEGRLLGVTPLIQYGTDPEGIALRVAADLLFLAFDGGARIAAFEYVPSGEVTATDTPGADCVMF